VVGVPHPVWQERPYALVVLKAGSRAEAGALMAHIRTAIEQGRLSKWALPEQLALVESIPKTSVGKIDKKRIRAELNQA
jgi:fatty-acyl-CoA synthase